MLGSEEKLRSMMTIGRECGSPRTDFISRYGYLVCVCVLGCSVMSDSLQLHGLQTTRLLVHGIFQARILEWVAISYSRGSS